ncbi:MAG: hypothetical protein JRN58_02975 [Nitrososphaerota archaeon]|nr:hypothetical protein [Nitrososphaerota archaeon]MDG6978022.1 hypothetical protein [Nitrososphaerota archaeon]
MPRRLGDDPLARARPGPPAGAAELEASDRSYNDVFFQRRVPDEAPSPSPARPEAPEISEISELPEIREAASSQVEPQAPAPVSTVAEVVAGMYAETSPPVQPAPQPTAEADEGEQKGGLLRRIFGKLM